MAHGDLAISSTAIQVPPKSGLETASALDAKIKRLSRLKGLC